MRGESLVLSECHLCCLSVCSPAEFFLREGICTCRQLGVAALGGWRGQGHMNRNCTISHSSLQREHACKKL